MMTDDTERDWIDWACADTEVEAIEVVMPFTLNAEIKWWRIDDVTSMYFGAGTITPPADEDLFCGGPITVAAPVEPEPPEETATEMTARDWRHWIENRRNHLSRIAKTDQAQATPLSRDDLVSRMELRCQMADTDQTATPALVPVLHAMTDTGVCRKCGRTMMQITEDPIAECLLQIDFSSVTRGVVGG